VGGPVDQFQVEQIVTCLVALIEVWNQWITYHITTCSVRVLCTSVFML